MTNCQPEYGEHADHAATDRTGTNPLTGDTYTIFTCGCGQDDLEIFTQYLPQ